MAFAQTAPPTDAAIQQKNVASRIEAQSNLVVVRVVVRDAKGNVVGKLRKEDFQLFDNGKPQTISQFAVESNGEKFLTSPGPHGQAPAVAGATAAESPVTSGSRRYLALYFDDVHMLADEVTRSRDAAARYLDSALQPEDRTGIFTSSGQHVLEFTDDRAQLREALSQIHPRPLVGSGTDPCTDISDYQAFMIVEQHDRAALELAAEEIYQCRYGKEDPTAKDRARRMAESDAMRVLHESETESMRVLHEVETLVARMAPLPGQRDIVLVSPGFFAESLISNLDEIIGRALRANVVISALDARGLNVVIPGRDNEKTVDMPEASEGPPIDTSPGGRAGARRGPSAGGSSGQQPGTGNTTRPKQQKSFAMGFSGNIQTTRSQLALTRQRIVAGPLQSLAEGTGGTFFNNNNDLEQGFRASGALPEVSYILAFAPENLKADGRFHTIGVKLTAGKGLTLQARRGYFAPKGAPDAAAQAEEQLRLASLSQREMNDLPLVVQTQFFKVNQASARLSIVAHVDIHSLRFRKENGENLNKLTFVAVLYGSDGKYVTGAQKVVNLHLSDSTLPKMLEAGITVALRFDVAPGTYRLRQVVRDHEAGQIAALNHSVEIPF